MNPTISIEGHHFALALCDNGREHTILIPIAQPEKLIALLQARRTGSLRIAEPGSPVQSMIDRPREVAQIERFTMAQHAAVLEDLGI